MNKLIKIEKLLTDKSLVKGVYPSMEKIISRRRSKKIELVYGETYDKYGLTIDSFKYYFFLSLLHNALQNTGLVVNSTVIIGDIHSVANKVVKSKDLLLKNAVSRLKMLERIKKIYRLPFRLLLMSSIMSQNSFAKTVEEVRTVFESSGSLKRLAEKTVLKNRLKQERESGFRYTVEEVALTMEYDIKIGPPREICYDQIAREIGKVLGVGKLSGVYLKPTYPLGFNFDYFVCRPEIEKYGLTPYKAGSNVLHDHRVILGKTSLKKAKRLIDNSFIPPNQGLPNPVFDLYLITVMARLFLQKNGEDFSLKIKLPDNGDLERLTLENLRTFIYKPLGFLNR